MVYKISRFIYFKMRVTKITDQYQRCHNCKLYPENYFGVFFQNIWSKRKPKININVFLVHGWANHKFLLLSVNSNIPYVTYFANYKIKTMHLINISAHARHFQFSFFLQHCNITSTISLNHKKRAKDYYKFYFSVSSRFL